MEQLIIPCLILLTISIGTPIMLICYDNCESEKYIEII